MTVSMLPLRRGSLPPTCASSPALPHRAFQALDLESLNDLDLLALLVGGGAGGLDRARETLDLFGDVHGIERAALPELMKVRGIGPRGASALRAAFALGRRAAYRERARGDKVRCASDVHQRLSPLLRHLDREVFLVVLLDNRHRIIREVRVAEGGLTACAVQPRDVLQPAVREDAAAVIFAHNHPSGDPTPSQEDVSLTRRLCIGADALGIRALDHVVLGDGRYVSLADRGLMGAPQ